MSYEDKLKWKGKHVKGDNERVEIRRSNGTQLVIVVYKYTMPNDKEIKISMNGPLWLNNKEYGEMLQVIAEAKELMKG